MAYVKNLDPNGVRILTDYGIAVESGEWAEVPDDVAETLAQQSVWEVVHPDGSPVKAANARAEHAAEEEAETANAGVELTGLPADESVKAPRKTKKSTKAEEAN